MLTVKVAGDFKDDEPSIVASWRPNSPAVITNTALVGAKAAGLFRLPDVWAPPFLVLTMRFTALWSQESDGEHALLSVPPNERALWKEFFDVVIPERGGEAIVRSNAVSEDISLRGAYDSYHVDGNIDHSLVAVERVLERHSSDEPMATLLQAMVTPSWAGHMSNERHIARTPRSWLIEGLQENRAVQHRIRAGVSSPAQPLLAQSRTGVEDALKAVAGWLKDKPPSRYHCEWAWDGKRVWIVQADAADPQVDSSVADSYLNAKQAAPVRFEPMLLKHFRDAPEPERWGKLKRPNLFRSLGLPTAAIYFLRGDQWNDSKTREDLLRDLDAMRIRPIVVRCDVADDTELDETLLPTSAPLSDVSEILEFLSGTAEAFKEQGFTDRNWAFLFAHLIPAHASAMILARPRAERIQVDALWGFPDGLLHFPHDTCFIYTGRKPPRYFTRFKGSCLLPRSELWQPESVGPPHDWNPVLTGAEAKALASWAGTLANAVGHEVQLMALARIGGERGVGACLPFHYTDWTVPTYGQSVVALPNRRDLGTVRTVEDIAAFRESRGAGVAAFVLRPRVDLLRSKDFLRGAAALSAEQGKPIYFEGSLLAHAYYIMRKAGATVIPITQEEPREERKRYHKLVRDNIPVIIREAGGVAQVRHVARDHAMTLLKQKLVEEAFEVWDSDSGSIVEELADVLEVIDAIRSNGDIDIKQLESVRRDKKASRGGFEHMVFLEETGIRSLQESDDHGLVSLFSELPTIPEAPKLPSTWVDVLPNKTDSDLLRFEVPLIPPVGGAPQNFFEVRSELFNVDVTYEHNRACISVRRPRAQRSTDQLELFGAVSGPRVEQRV